jgi:hypothetical protein
MNVPNSSKRKIDIWGTIIGGIFGGGGGGGRGPAQGDYELADQFLQELANSTGGREYKADSVQNMTQAFANVAEELRRQYSIGYYPKRPPQAGERRYIRVRARQQNIAVRTRDSYIFNPSGGPNVVDNNTQRNVFPIRTR